MLVYVTLVGTRRNECAEENELGLWQDALSLLCASVLAGFMTSRGDRAAGDVGRPKPVEQTAPPAESPRNLKSRDSRRLPDSV